MYVFIAGGGRTGAQLATQLLAQNYQVRLIEHRRELLARLPALRLSDLLAVACRRCEPASRGGAATRS